MTRLLLVRHAHAGKRGTWPGDDFDRELSALGREQAARLAARLPSLHGAAITSVASSRAVRCVDTVEPVADTLGLEVVEEPVLLEGVDPVEALAWLESEDAADVACSHGDVIGGVVTLLVDRGIVAPADARWPKASTWVLERENGRIVGADLVRAPSAG